MCAGPSSCLRPSPSSPASFQLLVDDAICLVLSPLVLELSLSLKRKPIPYLLAVAMASPSRESSGLR